MRWPPRSFTSCNSLPPEGAAAPVARQSRFHGPGLLGEVPPWSFTAYRSLPPEGAAAPVARQSRFHGPGWWRWPPRSFTSCNSLPPEGAAAPAAWQSQFRDPGLIGNAPTLVTSCSALHLAGRRSPEASLLAPVQTCSSSFGAAGSSPERAGAPAAWRSQFHGPCLAGALAKSFRGCL